MYDILLLFFFVSVENQIRIAQFSAGVDISMAVSTEGDVYGWGKSKGGRIGVGNKDEDVLLPRHVPLDTKAIDVECGYVHSVIVSVDGSILICGGVGINGSDDGQQQQQPIQESDVAEEEEVMNNTDGKRHVMRLVLLLLLKASCGQIKGNLTSNTNILYGIFFPGQKRVSCQSS